MLGRDDMGGRVSGSQAEFSVRLLLDGAPMMSVGGIHKQFRIVAFRSAILLMTVMMGGCAFQGDFGRPRKSLVLDQVTTAVDKAIGLISRNHSKFALTDEEIELRKSAHHFQQPLPKPLFPGRAVHMFKNRRLVSATDYAERLTSDGYSNGVSRVASISDRLETDKVWLKRFEISSKAVFAADRKRQRIMLQDFYVYSEDDRLNMHARIAENRDIMLAALMDLNERLVYYGYAFERTRLELPQSELRRLETLLALLREKAGHLRIALRLDDGPLPLLTGTK